MMKMELQGYKFIKEVNSDIEMLEFMRENEDNVAMFKNNKLTWRHYECYGEDDDKQLVWGNNKLYAVTLDDYSYKCYSKITHPLDEVNIDMKGSFSVSDTGDIFIKSFGSIDKADCKLFALLNTFKSKEQAQRMKDKMLWLLTLNKIKQEIDDDFEPDWNNYNQNKYCITKVGKEYTISNAGYTNNKESIYFSSKEKAQQALDFLERLSEHYNLRWF